jgi:CRP-like cAMP-binding protein
MESVSRRVRFRVGDVLFEEAADAETFYVIDQGKVGLELTSPGRPPIVIQTLGDGDLVGISWLFPPQRWNWRAKALTDTTATSFDAAAVRLACDRDSALARQVLEVIAREAVGRLQSTRLQLLDLYGESR